MNRNTAVKLILFIFFIIFFGFLFYYFYNPVLENNKKQNNNNTQQKEDVSIFPFFGNNSKESLDKEKEEKQQKEEKKEKEKQQKEEIPKLRQISKIPTAGAFVEKISKTEIFDINKERERENKLDINGDYYEIRYISTKNNHLFRTYNFTLKDQRITNITIPKIFNSLFFNKNNYIVQYINDFNTIKTYSIKISDKTKEEQDEEKNSNPDSQNYKLKKFEGIFLPDNILDIKNNTENKNIFYIQENKDKEYKIKGIISSNQGENKKQIFQSELKEWNFSYNSKDYIKANTKPAKDAYSYSISINTKTAEQKEQTKSKKSLNSLPNYDFSKIAYSYINKENKYVLYIKDLKTKKENKININTIVDKCVWSKNNIDLYCAYTSKGIKNNDLENWYKGKIHLDQNGVLKINTQSETENIFFDNELYNQNFDIVDLKIDDTDKYLYFKDKKTDFYWLYKLGS